jgi:hypothetical protein
MATKVESPFRLVPVETEVSSHNYIVVSAKSESEVHLACWHGFSTHARTKAEPTRRERHPAPKVQPMVDQS